MTRLFLCDARRQIRSIVKLCEDFGDRRIRAKRAHQNDSFVLKIGGDGGNFVLNEVTKAEHTRGM